jgi:hypothetical protein
VNTALTKQSTQDERRRRARRTALVLAIAAGLIYAAFILTSVKLGLK